MKFSVGILVWKQYAELVKCLKSVLLSTALPERIFIWDNGGEAEKYAPLMDILNSMPTNKWRIFSETNSSGVTQNTGCAGGWNRLLKLIHPEVAIILNDDCEVLPDTFAKMIAVNGPALVTGFRFGCFRQDAEISERVGDYDEQFWPAYYEDADYVARMKRAGVEIVDLVNIIKSHGNHGERPYQNLNPTELAEFHQHIERNKLRFISKWGKLPSEM